MVSQLNSSVVQHKQMESNGLAWQSVCAPLVKIMHKGDLEYFNNGSVQGVLGDSSHPLVPIE